MPGVAAWAWELVPLLVQHLGPMGANGRWNAARDLYGEDGPCLVIFTNTEEDHMLVQLLWP